MDFVELDLAGDADIVRLLEFLDHRIRLDRVGALHGFRVDIDRIVSADTGVDRCGSEAFDELIPERDGLGRQLGAGCEQADSLGQRLAADAGEEVRVLALHVDAADRNRHLRVMPLLDEDVRGGVRQDNDQILRAARFDLRKQRREVRRRGVEELGHRHFSAGLDRALLQDRHQILHPLGVLADDGYLLQAHLALQLAADEVHQRASLMAGMDRGHAEDVLVVFVVGLHLCGDRGRCRADPEIDCLRIGNVRQLGQRDAAGVTADQHIDLVVGCEFLDRSDTLFGILGFVSGNHFELPADESAFAVDVLDRHLDGVLRVAADLKLDRGRNADLDGLLGRGRGWSEKGAGADDARTCEQAEK